MSDTDDEGYPSQKSDASGEGGDPVAALVARGDHPAAARLAAERGDLRRAIALYERIWRFAEALPLALRLGDRALAVRLALDAGDAGQAARIADEVSREHAAELTAVAQSFASRGRHWEAARSAERAGEIEMATGYFRRAGSLFDVGRMEELANRPRDAGLAYEQALAAATDAESRAVAQLALGRLLARMGRHQDAARALQRALRAPVPALRLAAGRALTAQLVALGFRVAAAEIVRRLRRDWPELPASVDELAALDAADAAAGASAVSASGPAPGLVRQRFKVLRSLGAGATSHVYLAEDTLMGHQVALKLLSVGAGARGAERQAYMRFTREAEAAGRLRHPNIVALHDADPTMGLFVLELMPGGTLADRLLEGAAMPPWTVRRLALDLLAALAAAHDAGMVHRDVKPANVLFDAGGNAKLGDFGAAHLIDFGQTQTGGLLGTVAYMSPEQISGGTIGPAADLYALGVTLFEALTGRLPFPGPDIVAQHLGQEPPRVTDARGESRDSEGERQAALTDAHDRVLLRALRKAPSERWRSAAHMAEAVRAWPAEDPHAAMAGAPDARAAQTVSRSRAEAAAGPRIAVPSVVSSVASSVASSVVPSAPDTAIGRSRCGTLFRHVDDASGRPVLIERRDRPVNEVERAEVQALAAVGGPHVQRILALSEDGATVTFELCDGPLVSAADLSSEQADAIAAANVAVDAARASAGADVDYDPRSVVMTGGGPVLLILAPPR